MNFSSRVWIPLSSSCSVVFLSELLADVGHVPENWLNYNCLTFNPPAKSDDQPVLLTIESAVCRRKAATTIQHRTLFSSSFHSACILIIRNTVVPCWNPGQPGDEERQRTHHQWPPRWARPSRREDEQIYLYRTDCISSSGGSHWDRYKIKLQCAMWSQRKHLSYVSGKV